MVRRLFQLGLVFSGALQCLPTAMPPSDDSLAIAVFFYNMAYQFPSHVYAIDQGNALVRSYGVTNYVPSATGTTASGASAPSNGALHPAMRHLFVSHNIGAGNLQVFRIGDDYSLTAGASVTHATFLNDVIADPSGLFVYVPVFSGVGITGYHFNSVTGGLSLIGALPTGTAPFALAQSADGQHIYAADSAGNTVVAVLRNSVSGGLSIINSQASGTQPRGIAIDPTGRFVIATCGGGNLINVYSRNAVTGSLTSASSFAPVASANPRGPVFDRAGLMLVPYTGLSLIARFYLDPITGALTLLDTITTGAAPRRLAFSRDGKFLYVVTSTANTLETYRYDAVPVLVSSLGAGSSPQGVLVMHTSVAAGGRPL